MHSGRPLGQSRVFRGKDGPQLHNPNVATVAGKRSASPKPRSWWNGELRSRPRAHPGIFVHRIVHNPSPEKRDLSSAPCTVSNVSNWSAITRRQKRRDNNMVAWTRDEMAPARAALELEDEPGYCRPWRANPQTMISSRCSPKTACRYRPVLLTDDAHDADPINAGVVTVTALPGLGVPSGRFVRHDPRRQDQPCDPGAMAGLVSGHLANWMIGKWVKGMGDGAWTCGRRQRVVGDGACRHRQGWLDQPQAAEKCDLPRRALAWSTASSPTRF
jgi:hypothetical protein